MGEAESFSIKHATLSTRPNIHPYDCWCGGQLQRWRLARKVSRMTSSTRNRVVERVDLGPINSGTTVRGNECDVAVVDHVGGEPVDVLSEPRLHSESSATEARTWDTNVGRYRRQTVQTPQPCVASITRCICLASVFADLMEDTPACPLWGPT